jgi:hypothetical protein
MSELMKRLFMLRHSKHGAVVLGGDRQPLYFDTKSEAKKTRDTLGGTTVVTLGIDHKLYKESK